MYCGNAIVVLIATPDTDNMSYYGYTHNNWVCLTNMSAILFLSALITFLFGIVLELISALNYKDIENAKRRTSR
jgi:hypothetical protein